MSHEKFMNLAIELSMHSIQNQGGPFGAVVVKSGEIIAACSNKVTLKNDPTAHAEVEAIRAACAKLNTYVLDDCVIYSSCEPCPMCMSAIYWAHIKTVYYCNSRHDAKLIGFDDSLIYDELKIDASKRLIPSIKISNENGIKVFDEWTKIEDKKNY